MSFIKESYDLILFLYEGQLCFGEFIFIKHGNHIIDCYVNIK